MEYRSRTLNMNGERSQNRYIFSSRIICGECGNHFRRQKIYIGKPYEKIIWTCHKHVEDKEFCHMKAIREDVLQQAFVSMWNKLYTNQGTILEPLLKALTDLAASKPDTEEIEQLDNEIPHPWHPNIRYFGEFAGRVCLNTLNSHTSLAWCVDRVALYLRYDLYHAIQEPPYPEDPKVARWIIQQGEPNEWIFFDQPSLNAENRAIK